MGLAPEFSARHGKVVTYGAVNPYGLIPGGGTELQFGIRQALRLMRKLPQRVGARRRLLGACALAAAQRLRGDAPPGG